MPIFWSVVAVLPHLILFLRHGGDFIGYPLGGELDVVHENLLCFVAADAHYQEDGVLRQCFEDVLYRLSNAGGIILS